VPGGRPRRQRRLRRLHLLARARQLDDRRGGAARLVIGSDTLSRFTNFKDRATAILFGDGAGAVVVEAGAADDLILAYDLGADGTAAPLLFAEIGGYIEMDGREIFRRAVRAEVDSITKVFAAAGCRAEDIALFVPTRRTCGSSRRSMRASGCPWSAPSSSSTGSATPPRGRSLWLADAVEAGRVEDGDLVLLSGFGAGMTWASVIIRWGRRGVT